MADQNHNILTSVSRFFRLISLDKKDISYIYLYAIFSGLINLSLPLGVQAIIGLVAGGALSASLFLLVGAITVGTALVGILRIMQMTVTETLQRRIFARSSFDFAYRLPRLKLEELSEKYTPELVNRFFDTLTVQKGLPKILMDVSTALLQILFGVILIAFYHPFFGVFGVFLVVFLILVFWFTGPGGLKTSLKESEIKYKVASWLEEVGRSMNTFKLAGGQSLALSKTDGLVERYLGARRDHFRILIGQFGYMVAFKVVITAALLLIGGYLVIENRITIGQFVAADIVIILLLSSVEKLIVTLESIYDTLTGLEKIGMVTDLELERQNGQPFKVIDQGKGMAIEIHNLRFSFSGTSKEILKGIDMEVKAGEKLCIAGYNGSGKSMLLGILSGMYSEFRGQISYNGLPMQDLNPEDLRGYIGDYSLAEDIVEGTVMENITLCHPDVSTAEVVEAVREVKLEDEIAKLPKGYGTPLLPAGKNISRSMRARILLARAILTNPRLLVIEGYFAGLETSDKQCIYDLLVRPDAPWTLVTVTDDPYLAERCDRVLVLKDGAIVAQGTYDRIARSPHFPNIFNTDPANPLPAVA